MIERTLLITDNQHVIKTAYIEPALLTARLKTTQESNHRAPSDPSCTPRTSLFTGSATIAEDR